MTTASAPLTEAATLQALLDVCAGEHLALLLQEEASVSIHLDELRRAALGGERGGKKKQGVGVGDRVHGWRADGRLRGAMSVRVFGCGRRAHCAAKRIWLRPAALAWYIAPSASLRMASMLLSSGGNRVTPMLAEHRCSTVRAGPPSSPSARL